MEGIYTPKIEGKLSLRTSVTGMIQLEDVKVPKENILNIWNEGTFSYLNNARLGISFGVLGVPKLVFKCIKLYLEKTLFDQILPKTIVTNENGKYDNEYDYLFGCLHVKLNDKETNLQIMK